MKKPISELVRDLVEARIRCREWEVVYKQLKSERRKFYGAFTRFQVESVSARKASEALRRRLPCGGSVHAMKVYVGMIKENEDG